MKNSDKKNFPTIKNLSMANSKASCEKCRTCCKFKKDEKYFAPLFTDEEVEKILKKIKVNPPLFKKYKKFENIFQIRLKKISKDLFVCPFYNQSTAMCKIYRLRPIDCLIWPFFVARSKDGKRVLLFRFERACCLACKEADKNEFNLLQDRIKKLVSSKKIIDFYKKHKGLIWNYEKYGIKVAGLSII